MTLLLTIMERLLAMSLTAAFAVVIVFLLRLVLKRRAPKQIICMLWLVVFARLLIPVTVETPFSLVPAGLNDFVYEQVGELDGDPATEQEPVLQEPVAPPVSSAPVVTPPEVDQPQGPIDAPPMTGEPVLSGWLYALPAVWLIGVAAMLIYGVVSYGIVRRRVYAAVRCEDGVWEHHNLRAPFILGLFRPKIYLPMGIAGQPRQFILQHERAHLRRGDYIVKPICWLALAIHWFNPLAWVAFLLLSRDIETACDESVIRQLGTQVKAEYSATLLALATNSRFPSPSPLSFGEGDAKVRIKNVLKFKKPALWVSVVAVVAVIAAVVCLLTNPMTPAGPDLSGYTTQEAYPGLYFLEEPSSTVGTKITAYKLVDGELVLVGGYDEHQANNFFGLIGPDGEEELLFLGPDEVYTMFEELLAEACLEMDPNWERPGEHDSEPSAPEPIESEPSNPNDGPPSRFDLLGSLPFELVTSDTLPTDPEEYYLVAELPESYVWLYARNHGQDSMLLWLNTFCWPLEGRVAHTGHLNLPEMYLLKEDNSTATVAVVSEVDSGTGVGVDELAVYVMGINDLIGMRDYVYDWRSVAEEFSENNTLVYDADTNSLTLSWNGNTYSSGALAENMGQGLALEDGYTGTLLASGEIISFAHSGGSRFTVTMETAIAGQPLSIGAVGFDLTWTVEFTGNGFETAEVSIAATGNE